MKRPGRLARWLLRLPAHLYDLRLGWLLGHRFLRLSHVGRRSGRTYQTVLEVIGRDLDAEEVMVISGRGRAADWFRNLQAAPAVEVAVARSHFHHPDHRVLGPDEATIVLADYERRNRFAAPVVRLVLSRLIGWRYDGTAASRRRLAATLPVVAFRASRRALNDSQ